MSAPALAPGHIVGGKYTLRRTLGRRLHVATYHAITAPSRDVALKMFDPALAQNPELAARLRRTLEDANRLPASLALPVIETGVDAASGAPFVATELSVTPSLAELVHLCPLAGDELVAFVRSLAGAVDALHARGVFHLALSPGNVFVGAAPRFDVRFADIGPRIVVTPEDERWMAPEQGTQPSGACDVYAVALVTLFAALGAALEDRSDGALRTPATAAARQVGTALDARLDAPLARALSRDPTRRYRTATELATAIAGALSGAAVAPPSATIPAPPPVSAPPRVVRAPSIPPPLPPQPPRRSLPPPLPPDLASPIDPIKPSASDVPLPPPLPAPPPLPPPEPAWPEQAPLAMRPTEPAWVEAAPFAPAPQTGSPFVSDAANNASIPPIPGLSGPRRSKLPLVLGIALPVVAIGIVGAVLALRGAKPVAIKAAASASAVAVAPASVASKAAEPAAAAATTPAATTPDPPPNVAKTEDAGTSATEGKLTVTCKPACTTISVDGEEASSFPLAVGAGTHTVVAIRNAGMQQRHVTVRPGQSETLTVVWGATPAPAKKNCGKFLKRCD